MFYVYVLKSSRDNILYIGYTSDLRRRFEEHNKGLSVFDRLHGPFVLVYYEAYKSIKDAKLREKRLKQFKRAYSELKKRASESIKT
jgi:putative endonuclease